MHFNLLRFIYFACLCVCGRNFTTTGITGTVDVDAILLAVATLGKAGCSETYGTYANVKCYVIRDAVQVKK